MSVPQINVEILDNVFTKAYQDMEQLYQRNKTEKGGSITELDKLFLLKVNMSTKSKKAKKGSRYARLDTYKASDLYKV